MVSLEVLGKGRLIVVLEVEMEMALFEGEVVLRGNIGLRMREEENRLEIQMKETRLLNGLFYYRLMFFYVIHIIASRLGMGILGL